jgi:asparagine synthase (glutamine-hydrolysing)
MSLSGSPYHIAYNGEIYNHLEIRERLQIDPSSFHTSCDTESILAAYALLGARSLDELQGMFAFAIYDDQKRSLFLARDRLGIKPLYYYQSESLFAFASEIKSLLAHPDIHPRLNAAKLPVQMSLKYTLDDETLFGDIRKLPPAHAMSVTPESTKTFQYWELAFEPKHSFSSSEEVAQVFRSTFDESVRARLMADVPLGVFLSGGIDSSVIAASMSKMVSDPIQSFSVAFAEQGYSELQYARAAANHVGSTLHEIVVKPEEWFAAWPKMVYFEDEPIAFPSSIPLHFVSGLAAQRVKVVLTGEGSDELLGGYERYYQTLTNLRMGRFLPAPLRALTRSLIDTLPDSFGPKSKAVRTTLYLENNIESVFLDNYSAFTRRDLKKALIAPELRQAVDYMYSPFTDLMAACDSRHLLDQLLFADIKTYLVELLMKQDQMSMSTSLESRVPFLDHRLVEFICRLPVEYKLKGFSTKRILRMALGDTIPQQIVSRKKMGFPTPIREWFRGAYFPLIEDLLLSDDSLLAEHVVTDEIRNILHRHRIGEWDLTDQIWTLGNLEIWLRVFLDGREPQAIFEGTGGSRTNTRGGTLSQ